MRDSTAKRLSALHRLVYRATKGAIGRRLVNNDMLLLTTVGRRTGASHTVPLLYLVDGDARLYVIASWGGRPDHPQWYHNLTVNPRVEVELPRERFPAIATPLAEPDRTRWWERAVAAYDGYTAYQSRTDRVIPVVRITRR